MRLLVRASMKRGTVEAIGRDAGEDGEHDATLTVPVPASATPSEGEQQRRGRDSAGDAGRPAADEAAAAAAAAAAAEDDNGADSPSTPDAAITRDAGVIRDAGMRYGVGFTSDERAHIMGDQLLGLPGINPAEWRDWMDQWQCVPDLTHR